MRPIRVLELRSVRGTGGGPEKTILAGARHADPRHVAVTVCYIRDRRDSVFALDKTAAALGVDYVEVLERHSFDRTIWRQLREIVRARQIDIVHAHEYKTDFLAWLLARTEGVRPLSTVHGWSGFSRRELMLYYPADRLVLRGFARVIAVSTVIRDRLIRAGVPAERVSLVLNGIDPARFRREPGRVPAARAALGVADGVPLVCAVGRLEIEKRYDVLIDAFAALHRARPDARLVFAGTGSLHASLEAQARAAGVGGACIFAGQLSDVRDIYQAADVFVQSSDTEGTPNAVLEAMALETAIVATDVGGTADLVTDRVHALLVPRRDPEAIRAALASTLDSPEATAARIRAARARVEDDLSFDARMGAVERIYEDLARTEPSTSASWLTARAKQ